MSQAKDQVVVAKYTHYAVFKIPKDIDLKDCTYWVKWCKLYITKPDGKTIVVDEFFEPELKRPSETSIESAKDFGIDYKEESDVEYEEESEDEQ